MRLFMGLSLLLFASAVDPTACAADHDEFVYYRTSPMTAAGADSLGAVLLAQHLGVSHVAALGPEAGKAPRKGIVAFEERISSRAARARVIAWLTRRPDVVTAGLDKERVWAEPSRPRR